MDEKRQQREAERERIININDRADVKRYCREFQCNEMRLKNAVRAVGNSADAVREYMSKKF